MARALDARHDRLVEIRRRSKVDPALVARGQGGLARRIQRPDYVEYLRKVSSGRPGDDIAASSIGAKRKSSTALRSARWAEIADPSFNFKRAFARFREGYTPAAFRQRRRLRPRQPHGEMIARCVVECGTSSFYSAIRDATDEPVLKEIAGLIAADEFRHYRLFYDLMHAQANSRRRFGRASRSPRRACRSRGRRLSYAYYCANVPAGEAARSSTTARASSTPIRPVRCACIAAAYRARGRDDRPCHRPAPGIPRGEALGPRILGNPAPALWAAGDAKQLPKAA